MTAWLLTLLLLQQQTVARDTPIPRAGTGARISGVVIGDDGSRRPVRHALVTLSGLSSDEIVTGDDGAFAFADLPAGRYGLAVSKPGYALSEYGSRPGRDIGVPVALGAGQQLTELQLRLARGAVITGTLIGAGGEPVSSVTVTASRINETSTKGQRALVDVGEAVSDADGVYRIFGLPEGDFVVTAWPEASKDDAAVYAPTSYPSAADIANAPLISVRAGDEHGGADITLGASQRAAVSGMVADGDGHPASGVTVTLSPASDAGISTAGHGGSLSVRTGGDGGFIFPSVLAGTYSVIASDNIGVEVSPTRTTPPARWARSEVSVYGRDVAGMNLMLRPAAPLKGRAIFNGGSTGGSASIWLTSALGSAARARPNEDNIWALTGVVPGHYTLTAAATAPWRMESATLGERDVTSTGIDVGLEAVTGLTVTFTDQSGGARGILTTAAGAPAPDFIVVVFSAERARWAAMPSSASPFVAPDTNGAWAVTGLPPGEYRVAAITDWMSFSRVTPALLEQLMPASAPITITSGGMTTIDLRVGGF